MLCVVRVPGGVAVSDNASVLNATRNTANNAKYSISDSNYDVVGRLVETIDPMGMVTKFEYNNRDQRIKQTVAFGNPLASITESSFDAAGNVTEIRHPRYFDASDTEGHQLDKTTFTYDGANRNLTVTRAPGTPLAATSSTVYLWDGRVHKTIDPLNNETERLYVGCCDRTQVSENALGHGSISNADPEGRSYHSAFVADVAGHANYYNPTNATTYQESTTVYDGLGRAFRNTRWNVPQGQIDWNTVPAAGLNGVAASAGVTSQTFYDVNLTDGVGLNTAGGVAVTIPNTGATFNVNLTAAISKLASPPASGGASTSFATNAVGSATVSVNHDASSVTFQISDGAGRTVMSGQLNGPSHATPSGLLDWQCMTYDTTVSIVNYGTVQEIQSIDQANQISKTRTDAGGRTLESYDTLNKKSWAEYDPAGNVKKSRDPNNVGFDAVYDLLGRATSQTDTVGDVTSTSYDKAGNVKTQTDAKNKVTTTVYDVLGRTKGVTDRLTNETLYAYDLAGRMTSITDAQGKTTSYAYNALGAKTEETYPDHTGGNSGDATYGKVKFTYDPAGRMIRREDQKGDTVTFNHTMAGTITSRNYRTKANSPSGTIADSDTFTFDNLGRMLTAVSGRYSNTVTMNYDNYGRLKDESLTIAARTYTVTRAYDNRSRLTQLTYPNGSIVQRTYTTRSQLHTVRYLGTTVDTRTYDDGGRLGTSTYANGAVVSFAYRNDNLPTSIATTHAGSPNIGTYSYSWDANKNKTGETITSTMSGFGFSTGATGYDDEDRLQTWNRTNGTMNQAWTLSDVGNWDAFTSAGSTWNRTHSNAHEFTGFTGASTGTLAYDVKGNQTSRPSTLSAPALNLDWNFDNQLVGADTNGSAGSLEVTFEYDALGRRVSRSHSSGNVVYVHAGQQVIADYARGTAAASPSYRYVYADYVDEPILRHTGTGTTLPTTGDNALYYHRNQQYSIIGLTNAAGTLVERYSYTAYGTLGIYDSSGTVRTTSTYANRYTYTGREYDADLNLYHFRARWYDPATGGFISRDPLGYVDGMSLYRGYFGLELMDPHGLEPTGWHHPYCLYLGGQYCQPLFFLTSEQHTAAHDFLRSQGLYYGKSGRIKWQQMTDLQRRLAIFKSLKRAGLTVAEIAPYWDDIFKGANPGALTPRTGTPGKRIFLKGIGLAVGVTLDVLLDASTAYAAQPDPIWGVCKHKHVECLCRVLEYTYVEAHWWNLSPFESAGNLQRIANENPVNPIVENMGQMHFRHCKDLDQQIVDVKEEADVPGFRFVKVTSLSCEPKPATGPPELTPFDFDPWLPENR
ncbi:MAG: RHS repeat protein [Planctomycetaceae bacterium]|nr:RHS repeat protein [Planctomycetaceae bacterium]